MPGLIAAGSSGPAAVPFSMSYRCQVSRRMFAFTGASADKPARRAQPKRGVRQAQSQLTAGFARPGGVVPGPLKNFHNKVSRARWGHFLDCSARCFCGHPRRRWTPAQQRGTPGAGNASRRPGTGHPTPQRPIPRPARARNRIRGARPAGGSALRSAVPGQGRRLDSPGPPLECRPGHPTLSEPQATGGCSGLTARKPGPRTPAIFWAEAESRLAATGARCQAGGDGEVKGATSFPRVPRFRAERVGIG